MIDNTNTADSLRTWAKGMYTTEAATELLIRGFNGRFAASGPWIRRSAAALGPWIDFAVIPDRIGPLSGGERSYLLIAASIGSEQADVNLSDAVARLDRKHLQLVLAAIAHANGSHAHSKMVPDPDGKTATFRTLDSAYPCPEQR